MGASNTRSPNPAIRDLTRGLVAAPDEQILRAVALVDAMPERDQADQIIAPLRQRLARLRPPRPLRFSRLLFTPLDPLIVPAARWRPEQPVIPRTVIRPVADAVEAALGPAARSVMAMIAGYTMRDHAVVEEAGGRLWGLASEALMDAPLPMGWAATGLAPALFTPLSRRIGALLSQAGRLRRLVTDAAQGLVPPEPRLLRAMLTEMASRDAEAQPMLIALVLAHVPEAGPVLTRIVTGLRQNGEASLRQASEDATAVLLDQLSAPGGAEAQLGGQDLTEAGAAVHRMTLLLSTLEEEVVAPERRERLGALRERVRRGCEALFTERLSHCLLDPLRARGSDPGAVGDLETAARGLRVLETEARRVGGGKTYDRLLGEAADLVREITAEALLDRADGLRLMEILAGPDAALALYGEEP